VIDTALERLIIDGPGDKAKPVENIVKRPKPKTR